MTEDFLLRKLGISKVSRKPATLRRIERAKELASILSRPELTEVVTLTEICRTDDRCFVLPVHPDAFSIVFPEVK